MFEKLYKFYTKPRLIVLDLILINLAMFLSFFLRFDSAWFQYLDFKYFISITVISFIILFFSNLYNKMWQYASMAELYSILKITAIINTLFIIYLYFSTISFPRSIIIINAMTEIFFLGGSRFALRVLRDYIIRQNSHSARKRVLIIGAGDAAEIVIREMQKHPEMKKEIVGLIDDNPAKKNLEIHGKKVLGKRDKIPEIIKEYGVDEVIIAIPSAKGKTIRKLYQLSNKKGVKVEIVPGVYEILNGDVSLSQIREVKVEDLLRRDQVDLIDEDISAYLKERVILVSGGGGSIGSEICRQLAKFKPAEIIIFDINENNTYFLERELNDKFPELKVKSIIGSIRDRKKLEQVFSDFKPEVVFHAAAHKHVPLMETSPEEAVKNNIEGTKKIAETASKFKVSRFVLISTDKAVNPTNVMGASKRVAEMFVQSLNTKSNTKFMAVRFGNVLGSNGSVIPIFKRQIAKGGPITVTHREITRYFMTIPEASQLVIQAGALGQGGEVFVLDMGEPVKIIELAKDLISLSGLTLNEDVEIEIVGLRPGEKLYEELLCDNEKSTATKHKRIFINDLQTHNNQKLNQVITKLKNFARRNEKNNIINTLVQIVDNYQPKRNNVKSINFRREKNL